MITNPLEMLLSRGSQANRQLRTTEIARTIRTDLRCFAGGNNDGDKHAVDSDPQRRPDGGGKDGAGGGANEGA